MSSAAYWEAALITTFLATCVKAAEVWTELSASAAPRDKSSLLWTIGAIAAGIALLLIVAVPTLETLSSLQQQLVLGSILLIIGMRWLRKAIFQYMTCLPERAVCSALRVVTSAVDRPEASHGVDWLLFASIFRTGFAAALQIACIVVALDFTGAAPSATCSGILLALALVAVAGFIFQHVLAGVPAIRLQFSVGALLSGLGAYWTAQGLGFEWPASPKTILVLAFAFWAIGWAAVVRGGYLDKKYATIIPFRNPIP